MGLLTFIGKGWVVPAATFGLSLIIEFIAEGITGDDQYYQNHGLALALALGASAIINALVFWNYYAHQLKSSLPTNRKRRRSRQPALGWFDHSFLFINQGAWVVILLICGLVALIARGI